MEHFSFKTFAHKFDEHISNSIRGYADLCDDIIELSNMIIESGTNVLDIGCSTGKMIRQISVVNSEIKNNVKYIGVEIEERFKKYFANTENLEYYTDDILNLQFSNCSLIYSVFTLQFLSKKDRILLLNKIYKWLNDGGYFIFSEKVNLILDINDKMQGILLHRKRNYFEDKEILDKEYSLRFLMRTMSINENIKMCLDCGFKFVETFWQNHRFVGFIARK